MVASMERAFSYTGKQIETLGHKLIAAGGDLMFNPGRQTHLCQDEGCPHHGTDHACLPKRDDKPECKHAHMLPLFNAKREVIDYLCADCSHRTGGPTQTFTVFCRESNNEGTTWVGAVQARDIEEAGDIALEACAAEWSSDGPTWSPDDIIVLGVAEGDVKILEWNDPE
jgi:hypothetical protein